MSRPVRIATVSLFMDKDSNKPGIPVDRAVEAVEEAGARWRPDIVVLPELIDVAALDPNLWLSFFGEEIPSNGPLQTRFSALARKHHTYIVLPILEKYVDRLYNTAVLLDRNGVFAGKYRKTHLAPGENKRITPGDEYPIMDTDFGRIAISICMDIHFPELFRIYALEGAELILHPTMWYDYTGDYCESIVNARAIDNGVYLATSHYIQLPFLVGRWMGHSRIVDPWGRTRADTGHRPGIAFAEVDLDENYEYWPAQDDELKREYPTLKACFMKLRRPETYGVLTRSDNENRWNEHPPELHYPYKR